VVEPVTYNPAAWDVERARARVLKGGLEFPTEAIRWNRVALVGVAA